MSSRLAATALLLLPLIASSVCAVSHSRSSYARAAAAQFAASAPRRAVARPPPRRVPGSAPPLGHIYAVAQNGTNNLLNLVDVDLDTWETRVGPTLPPGLDTFGQAALYDAATLPGTPLLWVFLFSAADNLVAGFDVATGALAVTLNCSSWPGGGPYFISDIFAHGGPGELLVVGSYGSAAPGVQTLYAVSGAGGPAPSVAALGNITCGGIGGYCGDAALDVSRSLLFQVSGEDDTDDSGSLVVTNIATLAPVAAFALDAHFEFPQWDAATQSLIGLSLGTGGPNGYYRNVTLLVDPARGALNESSRGTIGGGFYVILSDGPKAFDAASRRLFVMLAGGPFAEFDVVTIDVDSSPPKIDEAPPLCGFIGYCPQGFAFGS